MLKKVISAIVMLLIFIPILLAGGKVFYLTVGILALFACKEMLDLKESHSKIPSGLVLASMLALLVLVFRDAETSILSYGISTRLFALLILIFLIPTLFSYKKGEYNTRDAFYLLGMLLFLGTSFNAMIVLRNMNLYILIYLFGITIITDTFALLIGMAFGRHKLAPEISPKKTWEGFLGGAIFGTIIPSIFYYFFISSENIIGTIIMTLVISVVAQLGDLIFSKIKRENNIKDFSDLIPGHGGILDRLDSTIFAIITYVLIIILI